jgi:hypothetical protein
MMNFRVKRCAAILKKTPWGLLIFPGDKKAGETNGGILDVAHTASWGANFVANGAVNITNCVVFPAQSKTDLDKARCEGQSLKYIARLVLSGT